MEESRQSESDTNVRDDAASPQETPRPDEVRLDEAPPRPPDSTIDSAVLVQALTTLQLETRVNAFVLVVGALQHDAMTDCWHMRDEPDLSRLDLFQLDYLREADFGESCLPADEQYALRTFSIITLRQGAPHLLVYKVHGFESFEKTMPISDFPGTIESIVEASVAMVTGRGIYGQIRFALFLPRRQPRVRGGRELGLVSYEEYPEDLSRPGLRSTFDFSSDKRLSEYLSNEFDAGAEHGMRSIVYVRGRHKSCPLRHDVSLTVDEIVACIRLWLDGRSSS